MIKIIFKYPILVKSVLIFFIKGLKFSYEKNLGIQKKREKKKEKKRTGEVERKDGRKTKKKRKKGSQSQRVN